MALADLIKKRVSIGVATATPATTATVALGIASSVAKVATVAVADLPGDRLIDPFKLIGERLAEIDRQGRPWIGFYEALTPADRQQLRDAEQAVDQTALVGDHAGVKKALDTYQALLATFRQRLH
jgi:hypothetical protein